MEEKQSRHILIKSQMNKATQNLAAEMFSVGIRSKVETEERRGQYTTQSYLVNVGANFYALINQPRHVWELKVPIPATVPCVMLPFTEADVYIRHALWSCAEQRRQQQQINCGTVELRSSLHKRHDDEIDWKMIFFSSFIKPHSNNWASQSRSLYLFIVIYLFICSHALSWAGEGIVKRDLSH